MAATRDLNRRAPGPQFLLLQGRNAFGRLRFRQGVIHGFARFVTERFEVRALRGGHGLIPCRPLFGIFPRVPSRWVLPWVCLTLCHGLLLVRIPSRVLRATCPQAPGYGDAQPDSPVILSPPAGMHARAGPSFPPCEDRGVTPSRSSAARSAPLSSWSKSYASTSAGMPWPPPGERGSGEHRQHRLKTPRGACSRLENPCSHSETTPWPGVAVLGIGLRQERVRRTVAGQQWHGHCSPQAALAAVEPDCTPRPWLLLAHTRQCSSSPHAG